MFKCVIWSADAVVSTSAWHLSSETTRWRMTASFLTAVDTVHQSHSAEWLHARTHIEPAICLHGQGTSLWEWQTWASDQISLHPSRVLFLCIAPPSLSSVSYQELKGRTTDDSSALSFVPPTPLAVIGLHVFFHMPVPVLDVVLNRRRGGRYTAYIEYKVMHLRLSRKKVRLGSVWRWSGIRRCEGNASELAFIYSCWLAVWESRAQSYEELWEAKSCWGSVDL